MRTGAGTADTPPAHDGADRALRRWAPRGQADAVARMRSSALTPATRLQSTRGRRPPARDGRPCRSCIREKQRRRAHCSYPCGWTLPVLVVARMTRCCFPGGAPRGRASEVRFTLWWRRWRWGGGRTAPAAEQSRCRIRHPRRGHVRAAARCRRPPSLTRHPAGVPRRPAAAQQGNPLPRRPADDRGDRRGHAPAPATASTAAGCAA